MTVSLPGSPSLDAGERGRLARDGYLVRERAFAGDDLARPASLVALARLLGSTP